MRIKAFTFNPFQENTYVISDKNGQCAIIDPGCRDHSEEKALVDYIHKNQLTPIAIWLTHAHIDHVLGLTFTSNQWQISTHIQELELPVYQMAPAVGLNYGIPISVLPEPKCTLRDSEYLNLGDLQLEIRFTPGHSPGSVCFIHHESKNILAGDVLFQGSIGRTDLPGGDYQTLIQSIHHQLLTLDDDYLVYPGHGDSTTIGIERKYNPFLT